MFWNITESHGNWAAWTYKNRSVREDGSDWTTSPLTSGLNYDSR